MHEARCYMWTGAVGRICIYRATMDSSRTPEIINILYNRAAPCTPFFPAKNPPGNHENKYLKVSRSHHAAPRQIMLLGDIKVERYVYVYLAFGDIFPKGRRASQVHNCSVEFLTILQNVLGCENFHTFFHGRVGVKKQG